MKPLSVIRSEARLEQLGNDSVICGAYHPGTIFQKQAPNEWVEPGSEDVWHTDSVWEWLTGAYEDLVMDEDREVWLIYDAATPREERPARSADSHDYASRIESRAPEYLTHATRDEALEAIRYAIGDGVSAGPSNLWHRPKGAHAYRPAGYFPPGTSAAAITD